MSTCWTFAKKETLKGETTYDKAGIQSWVQENGGLYNERHLNTLVFDENGQVTADQMTTAINEDPMRGQLWGLYNQVGTGEPLSNIQAQDFLVNYIGFEQSGFESLALSEADTISFEMMLAHTQTLEQARLAALKTQFDQVAASGEGAKDKISEEELRSLFEANEYPLDGFSEQFNEVDTTNDGALTFEEFSNSVLANIPFKAMPDQA